MGTGIDGTIRTVHDLWGNVIAEADTTGQTVREYLWIPEVGHAGVSLPIAVIDNVDTTTPVTYYVHTDHLSRPILMTDGAKATVWQAEWSPWGAPLSITASPEMNQRFPGQWYQLEAGLHYNWHRHYDPSLGRYTQPDPLGFVDGPSVFAYARNNPQMYVDPDVRLLIPPSSKPALPPSPGGSCTPENPRGGPGAGNGAAPIVPANAIKDFCKNAAKNLKGKLSAIALICGIVYSGGGGPTSPGPQTKPRQTQELSMGHELSSYVGFQFSLGDG